MDKYIYDESNGLWYELSGEVYLPCLTLPEEEQPVGVWGQRHLRYIREHRKLLYSRLLYTGKLNGYLADVDRQAGNTFFRLVNDLAEQEGITEALKADNQMEWVRRMNNVRNAATEVVNAELIYSQGI